jgi:lipopolysaccharide/colanic/teichoic acid biosynthesis glycosyltransferase
MLNDPVFAEVKKKWIENNHKLSVNEDPRITPIGKIIRRIDFDELAQLINVFRGEMSLVGPRAIFKHEMEEYIKTYPSLKKEFDNGFFYVRPGITGIWQIQPSKDDIPIVERVRMEAEYGRNHTLKDYILILIKTPFAIARDIYNAIK